MPGKQHIRAGRWLSGWVLVMVSLPLQAEVDARSLVQAAIDNWRGVSSYAEMSMTIHRPSWQRSLRIHSWTRGYDESLVRVVEPKKDAGNSTLILESQMWSYSPKINRVIKIPSSMMNQSWMGSDFSNKDISREDDIVNLYDHTLLETVEQEGHTYYTIEAIPHEEAAVVWGREVLKVRDDYVLISHDFYDQDGARVKTMKTYEIEFMSGRSVATRQRMIKLDEDDRWTELVVHAIQFDIDIPRQTFTLAKLRNPGG